MDDNPGETGASSKPLLRPEYQEYIRTDFNRSRTM